MKKLSILICLSLMIFAGIQAPGTHAAQKPATANYVAGEIMVKFKDGVSPDSAKKIFESKGCQLLRLMQPLSIYRLKIAPGKEVKQMVEVFKKDPNIKWAEPVWKVNI